MSDTFRKKYRELTDEEKQSVEAIKNAAEDLEAFYEGQKSNGKNPRHLALAMTNLEQSVMWAIKAVTE